MFITHFLTTSFFTMLLSTTTICLGMDMYTLSRPRVIRLRETTQAPPGESRENPSMSVTSGGSAEARGAATEAAVLDRWSSVCSLLDGRSAASTIEQSSEFLCPGVCSPFTFIWSFAPSFAASPFVFSGRASGSLTDLPPSFPSLCFLFLSEPVLLSATSSPSSDLYSVSWWNAVTGLSSAVLLLMRLLKKRKESVHSGWGKRVEKHLRGRWKCERRGQKVRKYYC